MVKLEAGETYYVVSSTEMDALESLLNQLVGQLLQYEQDTDTTRHANAILDAIRQEEAEQLELQFEGDPWGADLG